MRTTNVLDEIITIGVGAYLEKRAGTIENVGEPLVEYGETSVMINCYYFDDNGKPVPLYEFEDDGRIEQYDNFSSAFEAFYRGSRND
jgi:hypothetical protein